MAVSILSASHEHMPERMLAQISQPDQALGISPPISFLSTGRRDIDQRKVIVSPSETKEGMADAVPPPSRCNQRHQ